ncbi:hypothetical protein NEISICOT_01754 [Neisseria sicca ATCC 29256]|uniref:Uncharacterized protein n=1 Tax=Neisseria sicca ATCC 29256 TaxID=547045 RepID=C6M5F4_NEISI|nr:hypothetical protein NEISICOT_01754 [Neisseria sicca ATCC 29256]
MPFAKAVCCFKLCDTPYSEPALNPALLLCSNNRQTAGSLFCPILSLKKC